MRRVTSVILLACLTVPAMAQSVYVTDKLYLGLYAQPANNAQRVTVLHSGDKLEVLSTQDAWSQVRTADGTVGWAKSSYLVTDMPAILELAVTRNQIAALTAQLARTRQALEAARNTPAARQAAAAEKRAATLSAALESTRSELAAARSEKTSAEADLAAARQRLEQARHGPGLAPIAGVVGIGLLILLITFAAGARWHRNRLRARLGGLDI